MKMPRLQRRWTAAAGGDAEQRRLFGRILRNIGHLVGGNASAVAIGIVTLGLTAQMLGPALLGILAMVEAYGKLVDQVLRLETWQSVIRYGAGALENGRREAFARLIKLVVVIDLAGAGFAAGTAFLCAPLVGAWLDWDESTVAMAQVYSLSLLVGIASAPTGILRLFGRFAQIAWLSPAIAILRLLGVLIVWDLGGSVWAMLLLIVALLMAEHLALTLMGWMALRRHGYLKDAVRAPLKGSIALFPGFTGFLLSANGTVLIRKSTQELDLLVVGGVTGAIGAGIYQVARKFALAAIRAGAMLQQAAFPELARLWARGEIHRFVATMKRIEYLTLAFACTVVLTLLLAGDHIIRLIAGDEFEDAITPLLVHSLAGLLFLTGSALRPAVMATGHQAQMLYITAGSAVAFFAALFIAVPRLGVVGGSVAHIVFSAIWLPAAALLFASIVRRERPVAPAPPSGRD